MSQFPDEFQLLIDRFQNLPAVEALVLGGSQARGCADLCSDYDLYVYLGQSLGTNERAMAYHGLFSALELNNQYWEIEDDAIFLKCGLAIDIIFRDMAWIHGEMRQRLVEFKANVGFTTCIVEGIATGKLLFDRAGVFAALQSSAKMPYPRQLAESIIRKNQPLLRDALPAYRSQILKAFERGDRIAVNHRVSSFLASLFDILFALNLRLHPGEKRLMEIAQAQCSLLPRDFQPLLDRLLSSAASTDLRRGGSEAAFAIDTLCDDLDRLLKEAGMLPASL